jgi:hypothetical protein
MVQHVVMEQRSGVKEFENGREAKHAMTFETAKARGEHKKKRPEPLPLSEKGIARNVPDQGRAAFKKPFQLALDGFKMGIETVQYVIHGCSSPKVCTFLENPPLKNVNC